jgi:hypothetical protein
VIGLGVFPLVATLLAFAPGKGRERRPEERVLAFLVAAAGFCFVYYAGIKGAFLRENFGNIVVERNVIYLAPLLFVGLALFLERPRFGGRALAVAAVAGLFLVLHTPTLLAFRGYYDAPGIEVLQGLNRWFSVTETGVRVVLVALLLLSLEAVVLLRTARPAIARAAIAALAVVAVGWSLTGEIVFAGASVAHSQSLARNMATPRSWVDETVHGKPVIFLGANMNTSSAQATLYEAEFWNRSIVRQWTIDGLAPPLPTQTPNVDAQGYLLDGLYKPIAPGFEYFLTTQDVDLDGKELVGPPDDPVADTGIVQPPGATYKLWKVRQPARLAHTTRGLTLDGWATSPDGVAPAVVSYSQFATPGWKSGYIAVALNRTAGCATAFPTEHVVIRVGPLKVDPATNIPTVGKPARTRRVVLKPCDDQAPLIPAPKAPFEVSVTIAKTYRPRDFDDRTSESRWLAAQVGFDFVGYVPVG